MLFFVARLYCTCTLKWRGKPGGVSKFVFLALYIWSPPAIAGQREREEKRKRSEGYARKGGRPSPQADFALFFLTTNSPPKSKTWLSVELSTVKCQERGNGPRSREDADWRRWTALHCGAVVHGLCRHPFPLSSIIHAHRLRGGVRHRRSLLRHIMGTAASRLSAAIPTPFEKP